MADAPRDYTMAELRDLYVRDVDLVLAEGFKKNPHPRSRCSGRRSIPNGSAVLMTTVSPWSPNRPCHRRSPRFGPDDIPALCDFIERTILRGAAP